MTCGPKAPFLRSLLCLILVSVSLLPGALAPALTSGHQESFLRSSASRILLSVCLLAHLIPDIHTTGVRSTAQALTSLKSAYSTFGRLWSSFLLPKLLILSHTLRSLTSVFFLPLRARGMLVHVSYYAALLTHYGHNIGENKTKCPIYAAHFSISLCPLYTLFIFIHIPHLYLDYEIDRKSVV